MNLLNQALGKLPNANALQLVSEFVKYQNVLAVQSTERERIAAKRAIVLQSLANEREVILDYFAKRFSERANSLDQCFSLLSQAINDKNDKAIDASLAGLLGIIGDNPLSDFEAFKRFRQSGEILEI
jgi:hypothetical protein